MHTVHIPTWYHSIGERVMPSQLPALASRRLEITKLHVRLQQQIRRGSRSVESTSIALVDPPIPARVPPPPIESFAYRETGISSKRCNSNVIEIDDNSSR
nr:protein CHROMATIN REMODELING 19 [Ipomoea batatas]